MAKKYRLHGDEGLVQDTGTGLIISPNLAGRRWQAYQKWLNEGNTPDSWKTQEELDAENYAQLVQDDIERDETDAMKVKRAVSIAKLIGEGKLPADYKDPLF